MYLIRTYLSPSPIHGIGVFAKEFIKKGTIIWQFHPLMDVMFKNDQIENLPEIPQEFVKIHSYPLPFGSDNYCLSLDHSSYVNHSDTPNTEHCNGTSIALNDINVGEELTTNYYNIDHRLKDSNEIW